VKRVVGGIMTIFHYSLNGQIIAESNSTGTSTAEYVIRNVYFYIYTFENPNSRTGTINGVRSLPFD
jgi:hypothetical protein